METDRLNINQLIRIMEMSVEKYRIVKEATNYTTIPNNVLQGLTDYGALGLYAYLLSLPHDWVFYKQQLATHGDIGRDKLNKYLKILKQCKLIDFEQQRNEQGRYGEWNLHVKNGSEFVKIEQNAPQFPKPVDNSVPFTEKPLTEKPLTENPQLQKKDIYKENIKNKKSFCEDQKKDNKIKHPFAESMNQMASEKRNIEKHEQLKAIEMQGKRNCEQVVAYDTPKQAMEIMRRRLNY